MKRSTWYKIFLLAIFFAVWLWSAATPKHPDTWLLENYLVFAFVPFILLTQFWFPFSNLSYTFITIFMIFHVLGTHYTYSEVPLGYMLQDWLNASRNMYDRFVHLMFGLLFAYPFRESFIRSSKTTGFWSYYIPVEMTLAFSASYELIEYCAAIYADPHAGLSFLGTQGDIWDAQKDMLLGLLGSIIAMLIAFVGRLMVHTKEQKAQA